ncbi:MAG: histidine kinase [Acidobacteriota bacterium]|nr:histidine kinase [Acidobacteriota bacterium]
MNTPDAALLVNLLGFAVGLALYAMLLVMSVQRRRDTDRLDFLLLATALLGLLWNAGEFFAFVWRDFAQAEIAPIFAAAAYSALGFLPAVVVHSAFSTEKKNAKSNFLIFAAYILSFAAAALHFQAAVFRGVAPSNESLLILTFGYLLILTALFLLNLRQSIERKAIWASALAVFAVSALHLSLPHSSEGFWLTELVAHQASLPLAFAILYQNFRFAFADLFLKRALSLCLLAALVFVLYFAVGIPLFRIHAEHAPNDSQPVFVLFGLWMATALVYGYLHRAAVWFVDKVLLRRADYHKLRTEIRVEIETLETVEAVLNYICARFASVLTADNSNWKEIDKRRNAVFSNNAADVFVPTAEAPFYQINLSDFAGARRLLSDEIEMLEDAALIAARRIDQLRVTHERCEQELREQEIAKLASEAELKALRAQINPHFLFNALTTIGYLIQTAPEKALDTLLQLTQLLRGILRQNAEFTSLGDELKLIQNYLEIERARFEERLEVEIDVSPELKSLRVPSLVLQPLVENAVKHGISQKKAGGKVKISARLDENSLILEVTDTGAGVSLDELKLGIGLSNVENRLKTYYGEQANLAFESKAGAGATASIKMPIKAVTQKTF